jgi:tRNA U34 5-methylaminomethyl-2-thiouridine-forming methyltransferase MnmC
MAFENIVETQDGSLTIRDPISGECYHSIEGALLESFELYIQRSGICEKLSEKDSLTVLDVGLGLGYNALSTISAWMARGECDLTLLSLEKEAGLVDLLARGQAAWQSRWPKSWVDWCLKLEPEFNPDLDQDRISSKFKMKLIHPKTNSALTWTILIGDASKLNYLSYTFDYFWQDPFSPEKNPDMWSSDWFTFLRRQSNPNAVLMTYSVARKTKDALDSGGFHVERMKTPTQKKHWLKGTAR